MSETIKIRYKTEVVLPREGVFGDAARFAAKQPYIVGFVGGLLVALVAFSQSPGVMESAPTEAVFLALLVVAAWTVLVGFMRSSFANLALADFEVIREISYDGEELRFDDGEEPIAIANPEFHLVSRPVPKEVLADERAASQPWDVWVVTQVNDKAAFVLKTKVAASEAANYPDVSEDVEHNFDEYLPTHVASPLLVLARSE